MSTQMNQQRRSITLVLGLSVLSLISCQSADKPTAATHPAKELGKILPQDPALKLELFATGAKESKSEIAAQPITSMGDNSSASFSNDGSKILFVSRDRASHRHGQIYELDLKQMIERRLTFNDAETGDPQFLPNQGVVFSSATDEIKEEHFAIGRIRQSYFPESLKGAESTTTLDGTLNLGVRDLYLKERLGQIAERLTRTEGFDGEPSPDSTGQRFVFTSVRDGQVNLYLFNLKSGQVKRLTNGAFVDRSPQFSADDQWIVWSRWDPTTKSSQIYLADAAFKKPTPLTPPGYQDTSPTWDSSGKFIVFSSDREGDGRRRLFVVNQSGDCLKPLLSFDGDLAQPVLSRSGQQLAFTSNKSGKNQIYLAQLMARISCDK